MIQLENLVTGSQRRALKAAFKHSRKSPARLFMHGSVVIRGGNIVSYGWNSFYTHAEVAAIKKLHPEKRRDLIVWVLRSSRGGRKICESKPCPNCEAFMRENGVKWCYYSTSAGNIECMRL